MRKKASPFQDELLEHPGDALAPAIRPKLEVGITSCPELQPAQCRAARGFLKWSQAEAAAELDVGLSLLISFENGRRPQRKNLEKIKAGFEKAGATFSAKGRRLIVSFQADSSAVGDPRLSE